MKLLIFFVTIFTCEIYSQSCQEDIILLDTQELVDNFIINHPDCTVIEGDLFIQGGWDIANLDALSHIEEVKGKLRIAGNEGLEDISGFTSLVSVGTLEIWGNTNLYTLIGGFNGLKRVEHDLIIKQTDFEVILNSFIALETIGGDLDLYNNTSISEIGFPSLMSVGGTFRLYDGRSQIRLPDCPKLKSIGLDLLVESNDNMLDLVGLDSLDCVGRDLIIHGNPMIATFQIGNELKIENDLIIDGNIMLRLIDASTISDIGRNIIIQENPMFEEVVGFDRIERIHGNFDVSRNQSLTFFPIMNTLKVIEGNLIIRDNHILQNLTGLSDLDSVYRMVRIEDSALADFEGLNSLKAVDSLVVRDNHLMRNFKGFDSLSYLGNLVVERQPMQENFVGLESLVLIDGTAFIFQNSLQTLEGFSSLTKVTGDLMIAFNQNLISILGFENLEEVEGTVIISGNGVVSLIGFSALKKVGNDCEIYSNERLNSLTGLSSLHSVGSRLKLSDLNIENLRGLDSLVYVGELVITENKSLRDLDHLQNLEHTESLIIEHNDTLINLDGLSNCHSKPYFIEVAFNKELKNLDGLSSFQAIDSTLILFVHDNDELSVCNNAYICDVIDGYYNGANYSLGILDNNQSCSSLNDLENQCNLSSVSANIGMDVLIYPNPTSDFLCLSGIQSAQYEIVNVDGKVFKLGKAENEDCLDISDLPNGLYFYNLMGKYQSCMSFIKH